MIRIYVWQASEEELQIVHRLVSVTLGEKSSRQIHDLSLNQPIEFSEDDLLLACGMRCYNIVSSEAHSSNSVYRLPTPKQLVNVPANRAYRESAFKTLKDLANNGAMHISPPSKKLDPEELKSFTLPLLKKLENTLKEKEIDHWKCKTASGKTIAITLTPQDKIKGCDTVLTFEEVVAAKIATDLLNLDLITFVPGENNE